MMTKFDYFKCWIKYKVFHKQRKPKDVQEFWKKAENDSWKNYSQGIEKSIFLANLIERLPSLKDCKILELGCNVGRNLAYLESVGCKRLYGVELNKDAIEASKKIYPGLKAKIFNSTIEDFMQTHFEQYSLIFTMAVLEHIPQESEWIFASIAARSYYIVTIEDEKSISKICFPRNYKTIFERLGMQQIYETGCNEVHRSLTKNFKARIFQHEERK